jgi:hypothetical protein
VNTYFGSPLHRFGGDEVAYMWETAYNDKLFETFLEWLKDLSPNKSLALWDDPINDEGKNVNISKEWVIQSLNNGVTQEVLSRNHRAIVSESDAFYMENADYEKIMSFALPNNPIVAFPDNHNVLDLKWFGLLRKGKTQMISAKIGLWNPSKLLHSSADLETSTLLD